MERSKAGDSSREQDGSDLPVGAAIALNSALSEPLVIPISIRGDVNQKDLDLFSNLAEPVVDSGYTRIVFDLNEVDWFPDPCFGIFTRFLKPAKEHNGEVVFCGVKPEMKRQMATSHHHSDCEEMSRC